MATDLYQHDIAYLVELLDEVNSYKTTLISAKGDIERLAAMEKVIAYSTSLSHVAAWTMYKIRRPGLNRLETDGSARPQHVGGV